MLSLVICGFTLLPVNPDPAHCICDNPECGTVTCDFGTEESDYCQYKYYLLLFYWGLIAGDPDCPPALFY